MVFHEKKKGFSTVGIPSLNDRKILDDFSDAISPLFALSFLLMSAQEVENTSSLPWTSDHLTWTALPVM